MSAKDRLVELLAVQNLSQAEVARRIGEERDWVHKRTRGKLRIDADDIPRLARALGVPCSEFFRGSECPDSDVSVYGTSETPYRDLVVGEGAKELPEPERRFIEGMLTLSRRYRHERGGGE